MAIIKYLLRFAGTAALILVITSCLTQRQPLHVKDRPIKTETHRDVTASLRFVDEAIFKSKYREDYNPFLTDYNRMQLRRIVVFDLTVKNQSADELLFVMNRLELQYGAKTLQPYNRFQLGQHWIFNDENEGTKPLHKVRREKIIEDTVLPNSDIISAGGIMKGYVVFIGNTPNYGSAKVYVPLFKRKDVELHRFEFSFEF